MKKIPVGISDFEKLISNNYYYVDKTLFIKEILENGSQATLIPRPRRFGKTLNMSMLRYFFEKNEQSKKILFNGLAVTQHKECMEHQGQYPVIFISLKDTKTLSWEECFNEIKRCVSQEFTHHSYLLESDTLTNEQKESFLALIKKQATPSDYRNSLLTICQYLEKFHKKNPIILIDEYDSPIHAGYINNYYGQIIDFMRGFLGAGLKDNSSLNFAIITGILRVAKESIFSGLNNLHVCTILNNNYADKFGLTEQEVISLLQKTNLSSKISDVKKWYNGYTFGKHNAIYNPWSIINFIANNGQLDPYWINTSDNSIIKELIMHSPVNISEDIEHLLKSESLEKEINENIMFSLLHSNDNTIWSFLLLSGYLSFEKTYMRDDVPYCLTRLPNKEVALFYRNVVLEWINKSLNTKQYLYMLQALVSGNIESFRSIFYDMVKTSLSSFDIAGNEPERFYHALVLGMLVSLREHYEVNSNRESGYGRYDVMIIPRTITPESHGIIIEFKKVNTQHPTLEKAIKAALLQIEDKAYETHLRDLGLKNIAKLAIAFDGKKVLIQGSSNTE